MMELVALEEEEEISEIPPSTMQGYSEKMATSTPRRGLSPEPKYAGTQISDLPASHELPTDSLSESRWDHAVNLQVCENNKLLSSVNNFWSGL